MFIYIQYLQVTFMKQLCFPQFSVLSNKVGAIVTTLTMIAKVTTILLGAYYCYNESNAGLFGKIMHTLISHFCAFSFMKHPFSTTNFSCSVTHVKAKSSRYFGSSADSELDAPKGLGFNYFKKIAYLGAFANDHVIWWYFKYRVLLKNGMK